jgi:hypothetical protein
MFLASLRLCSSGPRLQAGTCEEGRGFDGARICNAFGINITIRSHHTHQRLSDSRTCYSFPPVTTWR